MFYLEFFCFFHDPVNVGNLISHSSAFSKTSLNIWEFTVHVLVKPGLENFEHYFTSVWDECYGFSCGHVWMWELDCEEGWVLKNWCFWTVVLEKSLESPLDCREIQPIHSEGDQPWDFFGRNDAKAETLVLWPPHGKSWLIGKDPDAERDWGQEEEGMTEDEMAGWHHRLDGHEFG